jgi:hypothetical protein
MSAEEIVAPLNPVRYSPYGFAWGPALVQRMWSWSRMDRGKRREAFCYSIHTGEVTTSSDGGSDIRNPRHRLHVYVSTTGRSVQVYLDGERLVRESVAKGLLAELEEARA